jgi:hypothetical protein
LIEAAFKNYYDARVMAIIVVTMRVIANASAIMGIAGAMMGIRKG